MLKSSYLLMIAIVLASAITGFGQQKVTLSNDDFPSSRPATKNSPDKPATTNYSVT